VSTAQNKRESEVRHHTVATNHSATKTKRHRARSQHACQHTSCLGRYRYTTRRARQVQRAHRRASCQNERALLQASELCEHTSTLIAVCAATAATPRPRPHDNGESERWRARSLAPHAYLRQTWRRQTRRRPAWERRQQPAWQQRPWAWQERKRRRLRRGGQRCFEIARSWLSTGGRSRSTR